MQFAVFMLSKTVGEAGDFNKNTCFLISDADGVNLRFILIFFLPDRFWVPHYAFGMMWVLVTFLAMPGT